MDSIAGSRVVVTGGAGFVGSYIVDHLLREGVEEIRVVDNFLRGSYRNLQESLSSKRLKIFEGDIRDQALLDKVFEGADYCFHQAALRITRCAEFPREALEVMYNGTFNVIESCVKHKIRKLVAASSASVYGQADTFPTLETHHPYNNRNLYGAAKMANELMYRAFHDMEGLPYVALRYFNVFGPRMDTEGKYTEVLIRWFHMIQKGEAPIIFGDGNQTMDFVYVNDIAKANLCALKSQQTNSVYNVASGTETSLKELCLALLAAMGSSIEPEFVPLPDDRKNVEVFRRLADITRCKNEIGFSAQTDLAKGLASLVEWLNSLDKNEPATTLCESSAV